MTGRLPPFATPTVERSRNMAAIHGRDTLLEMRVRRAAHSAGFRFRLHRRDIPGRPDLVFPRHRVAVFVNGCFWHGHSCSIAHIPRSNSAYWEEKISRNVKRDERNAAALRDRGWVVICIWECNVEAGVSDLLTFLATKRMNA